MAAIILPRRWQQQPTGPVEIDWRNPLTQGMAHCYLGGESYHVNLVTRGQDGTQTGRMGCAARPEGLATAGTGSAYMVDTTNAPQSLPLTIGVMAGGRPNAFGPVLASFTPGSVGSAIAAVGTGFIGNAYPEYRIDLDSGVYISDTDARSSLVNTTRPYVCRSLSSTDHALIVGQRITGNTSARNVVVANAQVGVGRSVLNNFASDTLANTAWFLLAAMWYRGLSDAEAFEFNAAPFQIFVPRRTVKYFDAGGGGVTGTLSVTLENFTSNINGTTTIVGTIAQTMAAFTSAITGTSEVPGTIAATTEAAVGALEGTVGTDGPTGTITGLVEDSMASMAGSTSIVGTMNVTLENFTQSAQGTTTVIGNMAVNLNDFTSAITGTTTVIGTSNITLDPFIMTANGYPGDAALIRIRTLVGAGE